MVNKFPQVGLTYEEGKEAVDDHICICAMI